MFGSKFIVLQLLLFLKLIKKGGDFQLKVSGRG